VIKIFNDAHLGKSTSPYMVHTCDSVVSDLQFCPYEDVLGVAHERGFVSLLVPGLLVIHHAASAELKIGI